MASRRRTGCQELLQRRAAREGVRSRDSGWFRRHVALQVSPIVVQRAGKAVAQRRRQPPSECALAQGGVRVGITDIDRLLLRWPLDTTVAASAGDRYGLFHEVPIEGPVVATRWRRLRAYVFVDSGGAVPIVWLRNSTGEEFRPRPRTTSAIQSLSTSTPVRKTRWKLKNCERPCVR